MSTMNAATTDERAEETELLADDGEDEVRVRGRQVEELLPRQPETDSPDAARAERVQRLDDLVAGALRVRPRVQERQEALQPVRRDDDRDRDDRRRPTRPDRRRSARRRRRARAGT